MKKVALYNNKGGVGKSTLAVNIAHALAKINYKVLLIDLDSQNDCSLMLGIDRKKERKTFYDLINPHSEDRLEDCIINARENLDLLPNSKYEVIEKEFNNNAMFLTTLLDEKLADLEEMDYDYVIFDCSPSRSIINSAILFYIDSIFIPVQLEIPAIDGLATIFDYLEDLRLDFAKIKLIIPNMYDSRTNEGKENLKMLKESFEGQDIVTSPVYRRIKITEATKQGKTIFEYDETAQKQLYPVIERVVDID